MVIDMNESQVRTLEQVRQVLAGTLEMAFRGAQNDTERYNWIASVLRRFEYRRRPRLERGVLLAYLGRLSGYSRAQINRLVRRWLAKEKLCKRYTTPAHAFSRTYTPADVVLLATVDQAMDTLSGAATTCVLRRQHTVFGDPAYARLAKLSVSHLYNLRRCNGYRAERVVLTKTRPTKAVTIGVRRAPRPDNRPGFIRIDSVHQGDLDGTKGLYHINAVDCVTQWQVVASVQTISEVHLLPVIIQMLDDFPFQIMGFHADNGSEYINHRVAALLTKLSAEFTRSRPRHSNDNGLVETKNGVVVRKLFGYQHIAQRHAVAFNTYCRELLNPFLNFHRPCLFATERPDPKKPGRIQRIYRPIDAMTPLDKLTSLPNAATFLRDTVTLSSLHQQAQMQTDVQAARAVQLARTALFKSVFKRVG
jgi:transposase InsO family protein